MTSEERRSRISNDVSASSRVALLEYTAKSPPSFNRSHLYFVRELHQCVSLTMHFLAIM